MSMRASLPRHHNNLPDDERSVENKTSLRNRQDESGNQAEHRVGIRE
jgi:hypothetical protein